MVTKTDRVSHKPGQRTCPKLMLTAFVCDYLTARAEELVRKN